MPPMSFQPYYQQPIAGQFIPQQPNLNFQGQQPYFFPGPAAPFHVDVPQSKNMSQAQDD